MSLFKKETDYKAYCRKCTHRKTSPIEEPCDECLSIPAQEETRIPIHYAEDKSNDKKGRPK